MSSSSVLIKKNHLKHQVKHDLQMSWCFTLNTIYPSTMTIYPCIMYYVHLSIKYYNVLLNLTFLNSDLLSLL